MQRSGAILSVGSFFVNLALAIANFVVPGDNALNIFAGAFCAVVALVLAVVSPAIQEFLWLRVVDLCKLADGVFWLVNARRRKARLNLLATRRLEQWRQGRRWQRGA